MNATQTLRNEHRVIEAVLTCLERIADELDSTRELDTYAAGQALEFLGTFADRCHHGKEEQLLFEHLESCGMPRDDGPTGVMRHEHDLGRKLMATMRQAVDNFHRQPVASAAQFLYAAREYIDLLRRHIQKEDHCLFPLADKLLGADERQDLESSFAKFESSHEMHAAHERCLAIAKHLTRRYGIEMDHAAVVSHGCCSGPFVTAPCGE